MRGISRYEFTTLFMVLLVPIFIGIGFPYRAVAFRAASSKSEPKAGAAFVELTESQEIAALAAAKTSWQVDAGNLRRLRVDLAVGDLPEDAPRPVLDSRDRPPWTEPAHVPYAAGAFVPTSAAARPARLAVEKSPVARPPAFSREALLKID